VRTRGRGSSDEDVRTFGAKYFEFFEIYGVSAQTRGRELSQCGHFADKGEGSIFCGRLL